MNRFVRPAAKRPWVLMMLALACPVTVGPVTVVNADDETPPPPVGLRYSDSDQGQHLDVVTPGRLLARAWPRLKPGAHRTLLLLVAPEGTPDGPRTLYQVPRRDDASTETLIALATNLPAGANALSHIDPDGDGVDLVLLGEPGTVHILTLAGTALKRRVLTAHEGLDLRAQPATIAGHGMPLAEVGGLQIMHPDRPNIAPIHDPLPVRARRKRAGLVLDSPPVTALDRGPDRAPLYAIGPESFGAQRLRTTLIDPERDGEDRRSEVWSILPGPESVEDSYYMFQDGRPRLLVTTLDAERMALFGRKRLRSFPLLADRTRRGKRSSISAETTSRRWQDVDMAITDIDDDGRDDLIVAQLDGLGGGKMALHVHRGTGSGKYDVRVRKTVLDREVNAWHIGTDFDGDGEPDLLIREDDHLALYAGAVRTTKKRALSARPSWELPLGPQSVGGRQGLADADTTTEVSVGTSGTDVRLPSLGTPAIVDLDGDGQNDIVLGTRNQRGRGRLHVVWLAPSSPEMDLTETVSRRQ